MIKSELTKDLYITDLLHNVHLSVYKRCLVANIENTNKVLTKRDKKRLDMHLHLEKQSLLDLHNCDYLEVNFIS